MKTFFDLKQEVRAKGLCHGCGGCVTFCTAVNYGALKMSDDNIPRYKSVEKCIDCGLCYQICPAVGELDDQVKRNVDWSAPMGRILQVSVAKSRDEEIQKRGTDGGVITAMLTHLLESGRIDGAIVSKQTEEGRIPWLATSTEELLESAGSHFDAVQGGVQLGNHYSTYTPSVQALGSLMRQGLKRIAFVGTPCQIKSVRKMQALNIVPSDSIKFFFGLFCSAHYDLDGETFEKVSELSGCTTGDVAKLSIKEDFLFHLNSGEIKPIALEKIDFAKRQACGFCKDFSAEYADISFGGLAADEGWTTVVTRTPLGRATFADARDNCLDIQSIDDYPGLDTRVMTKIMEVSTNKKVKAEAAM